MIEERVFYTEDKALLDNVVLKDYGFKHEFAATLGKDKKGWYIVIKASPEWFKKKEVVETLKNAEEVKDKEKEEILKKFAELEESVVSGVGSLFE